MSEGAQGSVSVPVPDPGFGFNHVSIEGESERGILSVLKVTVSICLFWSDSR